MAKKLTKKEQETKKRIWDDYLKDCIEEIKKDKLMKEGK